MDAAGASAEDDAGGVMGLEFVDGYVEGEDKAEDVGVAYTARNEFGVLRSEIQNNDGLCRMLHSLARFSLPLKGRCFDDSFLQGRYCGLI